MPTEQKPVFLIISQVYPPDPAAVGQYMHDAAQAMAQRGAEVRVLTSARGYDDHSVKYPPRQEIDGVHIRRLPLSSLGKKTIFIRLVAQSLFLLQSIVRGLFTRNLSCILISTSPPMASVAASVIRLFRRTAVKFWVMDLNPDQLIETGKITEDSLPARVFNFLNRRILKISNDVIPLDRFMADRLNKKRDVCEKMTVLPPWPLSDHLEPVEHADNPFREEHGLAGKFVVMYSGNHGRTTPVKTVLDAAVKMQDREDLVFMFIGGGAGKEDVEATLAEHQPTNIVDLPYQPLERVRYSLSAADVHVVTMGDNVVGVIHPCKVYGAMALGRPLLLVGPPECHVSDIMQNQSIGWHVQHGDVEGLIAAVDEMRQMPTEQLHSMGQQARQIVQTQFQRQQMVDEFLEIMFRGTPLEGGQP